MTVVAARAPAKVIVHLAGVVSGEAEADFEPVVGPGALDRAA